MLQIQNIHKQYKTGGLVQKALDGVSLNLRENEFVAILGPSGSGKTTLLNVIGGLDRYDSGDLIINGISTKKYKDRDWDSYRNHTVGFVFQSYNLIPHQTVLANVELALTISGVSKAERRQRAKRALEQVGLGQQMHKNPGQMSGGQMQRVAIARALVNDPDILLADEPTGALDSETSVQVMELLKEVARDRLVVMVTHNPELAEAYATRIVKLKDGRIADDSDPFEVTAASEQPPVHKSMGRSSMSLLTSLSLSFNNLRTKKARTLLTSFAGSIGIIGIALILALSNGVSVYIQSIEKDTLSKYPVQIQSSGVDMTALMGDGSNNTVKSDDGPVGVSQRITSMFSKVEANDLASLKTYLEQGKSGIDNYTNAIEYNYSSTPYIYRADGDSVRQVNPDRSFSALGVDSTANSNSLMSMMMNTDVFHQMPENASLYQSQYDIKAGRWPEKYNECVVVLTADGNINDFMLYTLGLRDAVELDEMIRHFLAEESVQEPTDIRSYRYDELMSAKFRLINAADCYEYDATYRVWKDKTGDKAYMKQLVSEGEEISIVGVVQPSENATAPMLVSGIGYPASLTRHTMEQAAASPIVRDQLSKPTVNVMTGNTFGEDNQSKLDLSNLFTVDADALKKAFQFDTSALGMDASGLLQLDGNALNTGDLFQLGDLQLDMPELSDLDMTALLNKLTITISSENASKLLDQLTNGYQQYAASHPEADYSKLSEHFLAYLQSEEGKKQLADAFGEILSSNANAAVIAKQLGDVLQDFMADFQKYAADNGMTDPSQMGEYLAAYLQTEQGQQKLVEGAQLVLKAAGQIELTPEQLEKLATTVVNGYQDYAVKNALPDPSRMGEHIAAYLQTDQAQQLIAQGVPTIINTADLEQQLSAAFSEMMGSAMTSMGDALQKQVAAAIQQMVSQLSSQLQASLQQAMSELGSRMSSALQISRDAFQNAIRMNMTEDELKELMMSLMSSESNSYDNNLKALGYSDENKPTEIAIYPKNFEGKAEVIRILDEYNARMESTGATEQVIRYTDMVGTLMSSVTEIIDTISYVLIAVVAISLVVSSIMIGVITYISVLERKKEIGILRAIGASKNNISQVFNAETFIIGLCAGVLGIALTLLLLIPGNMLIHSLAERSDINASLPPVAAIVLILLSVLLTLIGGLIPSRKAAKSDPVAALRSE